MKKRSFLCMSLLFWAASASADPVLDRAEVLRRAQKSAPVLAIAGARVAQTKASINGTSLVSLENPTVFLLGGVRFGDPKTPEFRGQLAVPFDLGGRPSARRETAEASVRVAAAEAEDTARLTAREALMRWARAVRDTKMLALARDRLKIAEALLDAAKKRVAAKDLGTGDVALLELERARDAAAVAQAVGNAQSSAILLGAFIGAPGDPTVSGELVDEAPMPTLESLLAAVDKRPDVRAVSAEIIEARARSGLAKADRWPTLNLVGTYEYHESTNFVLVGLSMPIPVFNANTQTVATTTAAIDVANARLEAARAMALGEIRAAWKRWSAAREALTTIRATAAPAAAAIDATAQSFLAGKSSIVEVLLVRRVANEAAVDRIAAELTFAESRIELDASAGRLP